jgi:hypothetical protein
MGHGENGQKEKVSRKGAKTQRKKEGRKEERREEREGERDTATGRLGFFMPPAGSPGR